MAGVDHRRRAGRPVDVERGVAAEAGRVDQRPAQEELVQESLLHAVGQLGEVREVAQDPGGVREIVRGHADLVRRANDEAVVVGEALQQVGAELRHAAEQPVAVDHRARGSRPWGDRGAWDDAAEVRLPVAVPGGEPPAVELEPGAHGAVRRQIARHCHGAGHVARDVRVLCRAEVGHVVDLERRRAALDLEVREVAVPELRERVVAHVQQSSADVAVARHGEIPGEIQAAAPDARPLQDPEDAIEVLAPRLDRLLVRVDIVAVVAERRRRGDRLALGRAQIPQRDDVAVLRTQVLRRVDLERRVLGRRRVGVDLRPDRRPLAGLGVDQHDRLAVALEAADVVDRRRAGGAHVLDAVQAGHAQHDRLPGAEPVVEVVRPGVDVRARGVRRHRLGLQVHAPPRGRAPVPDGVVVVRERQQAEPVLGAGDEVAAVGAGQVDRGEVGLRRRGAGGREHDRDGGDQAGRCARREPGLVGNLAAAHRSAPSFSNAYRKISENVGNGWIVSRSTSSGIRARTARVACCSHSPASGPRA